MGGDRNSLLFSSSDDSADEPMDRDFSDQPPRAPSLSGLCRNCSKTLGVEEENQETAIGYDEFEEVGSSASPKTRVDEANQKLKRNIHMAVLRSYDELKHRAESTQSIELAKAKILSYRPGSLFEAGCGTTIRDYDVPKTTTILLVGTKGSGKSTLVNKILEVFDDESFISQRAQVSFGSSIDHRTCCLREYAIPGCGGSICLYDTGSLCGSLDENDMLLKHWMTTGVKHGEPVLWELDDERFKAGMNNEALNRFQENVARRRVNFVVFIVNAVSVLESMESGDERKILTFNRAFSNPYVSFKDDGPVVVITHGDLLSLSDRVMVRVHLGELLCIHPKNQIFDIPESNDSATKLAVLDMLHSCLYRADRNLPRKNPISRPLLCAMVLLVLLLWIYCCFLSLGYVYRIARTSLIPSVDHIHHTINHFLSTLKTHNCHCDVPIEWSKIRHLWS